MNINIGGGLVTRCYIGLEEILVIMEPPTAETEKNKEKQYIPQPAEARFFSGYRILSGFLHHFSAG
jgi:hypothetical protein